MSARFDEYTADDARAHEAMQDEATPILDDERCTEDHKNWSEARSCPRCNPDELEDF